MPPAVITNVAPMLTTPITAAPRTIVNTLFASRNRSPDVIAPTMQMSSNATTRPRLRPSPPPPPRLERILRFFDGSGGARSRLGSGGEADETGPAALAAGTWALSRGAVHHQAEDTSRRA